VNPARFHLTLTTAAGKSAHGWWGSEATARGKAATWIGSWGQPGVRIVLVDEETGTVLTTWPDET
jgi:hypothetical protein